MTKRKTKRYKYLHAVLTYTELVFNNTIQKPKLTNHAECKIVMLCLKNGGDHPSIY